MFCYNPTDFARNEDELATEDWLRVLREARALGAVQLGLSGGEPLARDDLEIIVAEAHELGFYINLITSGVGLNETRIKALKEAGLDHIQLSFQDSTREMNDFLSSTRTFELKSKVAALIKQYDYPMVLNVVLHRMNIDHVEEILDDGRAHGRGVRGAGEHAVLRLGVAQSRTADAEPRAVAPCGAGRCSEFRERAGQKMRIFFVVPDYFETRPKPCMNGLGSIFLTMTPDGTALPCHAARMLPGFDFPNVRERGVEWIWRDSHAFNHFRGDAWMKEPCRSCPEKTKDFGGCRCQAFLLTGDAANADPVCDLSPHHHLVTEAVARAERPARRRKARAVLPRPRAIRAAYRDALADPRCSSSRSPSMLATRLWLSSRQIAAVRAHRDSVPEPFRDRIALADQQKAADYTVARARFGPHRHGVRSRFCCWRSRCGGGIAVDRCALAAAANCRNRGTARSSCCTVLSLMTHPSAVLACGASSGSRRGSASTA